MKNISINDPFYSCVLKENQVYQTIDNNDYHFNIIYPYTYYAQIDKQYKDKYPCMVFVQGSGWNKQDTNLEVAQLSRIARYGIVVAIVEYRDSDIVKFDGQIVDTCTCFNYLYNNADKYYIDNNNMFIAGDSSGGHCALHSYLRLQDKIKGCIDYYGVCELANKCINEGDELVLKVMGVDKVDINNPIWDKANVYKQLEINKVDKPVLILHGISDNVVSIKQSDDLYQVLVNKGVDVQYYRLENGVHGGNLFFSDDINNIVTTFIFTNSK